MHLETITNLVIITGFGFVPDGLFVTFTTISKTKKLSKYSALWKFVNSFQSLLDYQKIVNLLSAEIHYKDKQSIREILLRMKTGRDIFYILNPVFIM